MLKKLKICVFCSAAAQAGEPFITLARHVGWQIARYGFELVYGGGRSGLMGIVADAALAEGARVTGVIPSFLEEKEIAHRGLTHLEITQTMRQRIARMEELSDAFIILPGGAGTVAELFDVLTSRQLSLHDKPIFLLNTDRFWDGLLKQLNHMNNLGFLHGKQQGFLTISDNIEDIFAQL